MRKVDVINRVNEFLSEDFEVDVNELRPEAELKETLDLDSLDYVDLIVAIDTNFGFKVKPEEFQKMVTVGDFYNFICDKMNIKETV